MDNKSVLGYLQWTFDMLYIKYDAFALDDVTRRFIHDVMHDAFDQLTEEEAKEYYLKYSNTNIKE